MSESELDRKRDDGREIEIILFISLLFEKRRNIKAFASTPLHSNINIAKISPINYYTKTQVLAKTIQFVIVNISYSATEQRTICCGNYFCAARFERQGAKKQWFLVMGRGAKLRARLKTRLINRKLVQEFE